MDKDTYSALIDTERSRFLAACWERNEAPSDEAWRANLRRVACVYLHAAHKLMRHAIEDDESIEEHNQAVDEIVTLVNEDLRLSPAPWLPGTRGRTTTSSWRPGTRGRPSFRPCRMPTT